MIRVRQINSTTKIETEVTTYCGVKHLRCREWVFCEATKKWRIASQKYYSCVGYYTPGKGGERVEWVNGKLTYPDRVMVNIQYKEVLPKNGYVPYYAMEFIYWGEGDDFNFCHISQIVPVVKVNEIVHFRDGNYNDDSTFIHGFGWVKNVDAENVVAKLDGGKTTCLLKGDLPDGK